MKKDYKEDPMTELDEMRKEDATFMPEVAKRMEQSSLGVEGILKQLDLEKPNLDFPLPDLPELDLELPEFVLEWPEFDKE